MAKEKFVAHQVVERVGFGVGVQLALNPTQIHDRLHALAVDDEKPWLVTVTEPIEFRPGEIIGIGHDLTRYEAEALTPVEKQTKRGKQPNTTKNVGSAGAGDPDPSAPNAGDPDPNDPAGGDPDDGEDEGGADDGGEPGDAGDGDAGGK